MSEIKILSFREWRIKNADKLVRLSRNRRYIQGKTPIQFLITEYYDYLNMCMFNKNKLERLIRLTSSYTEIVAEYNHDKLNREIQKITGIL